MGEASEVQAVCVVANPLVLCLAARYPSCGAQVICAVAVL